MDRSSLSSGLTVRHRLIIVLTIALALAWWPAPWAGGRGASASNVNTSFHIKEDAIEVDDNTLCDWDGNGIYESCADRAVGNWSDYSSEVNLYSFDGTTDDDIVINWGNAEAYCPNMGNLDGCARFYYEDPDYFCLIVMDNSTTWYEQKYDQVARHELGHCLDLQHRYVEGDIMDDPFDMDDDITSHDISEVDCLVYEWQNPGGPPC